MSIVEIRSFFMWCSILNGLLLIVSFLATAYAGDWIYRMHGRWYSISREKFDVVIYSFIGLMKVIFIMANLVPYLALVIIG